ncbi:MAG TPA: ABC transporter ATP-binding protein [Candidatus Limnocylindrales bacterium]|nr:ABC transporter ATP-binding protein [Candidatus Limnocylindrales bacterium]
MTSVIEAVGLTKSYGRRRGIVDVSFEVREGEVFGFLGPNGAGKTTTIRTLLGLLRPTAGRAALFGIDAWTDAPRAHASISYVGSDPAYLGELTAAAQLDYVARLRRLPRGAWRPVAERFELDPTVPIKRLSRGNRQKVGVVQAFMGEAPLMILDEPTTGLDPLMQREFLAALSEVRAGGRTVFLSSHNLPEVERSCDRVGIIREGRLADIVTVQALLAGHWRSVNLVLEATVPPDTFDLPNVRVASITARDVHLMVQGDVNPLLRKLATVDLLDVSITTPEIEDVFLRLYSAGDQPAAEPPTSPEHAEVAR